MEFGDLVRLAREKQASDLHLVQGLPPALRINGEIIMAPGEGIPPDELRRIIGSILTEAQKQHFESNKELCFSVPDGHGGRMRVTVYMHAGTPEVSIRLTSPTIPAGDLLGLPPIIDELARRPNGLVLITGATGSGKTTTLNYMVDLINRERRCKIVTIEDPVEYVHHSIKSIIVQQEVHTDTLSFSRALIHVLRQNPDVIVIGEMRELETIATALTAAETGHLVVATLHTPNSMQTVERMTAVFPPGQQKQVLIQLANSLLAVITQDLIPRADRKGRVLAYEVLVATPAVRNIIRENNIHSINSVIETSRKDGMLLKDQCLLDLYQRAMITYDQAFTRARNWEFLAQQALGKGSQGQQPAGAVPRAARTS